MTTNLHKVNPVGSYAFIFILSVSKVALAEDSSNHYGDCSSHATCQDCSSSYNCHWCSGDELCHSYGSWYGCAYGVSNCKSIKRCMRTEAEQKGFTWKGIMIILGAFALITTLSFHFLTRRKKDINQTRDVSLNCDETPINADGTNEGIYESINDTTEAEKFAQRNYDPKILKLKLVKAFVIGIALVMVGIASPKMPQINICSTEMDWESLLENIINDDDDAMVHVSMDTLVSIYNPSLYTVQVETVKVSFLHNQVVFARAEMQPFILSSQSISDDILVFTLAPSNFEVLYGIWNDYSSSSTMHNVTVNASLELTFQDFIHVQKDFRGINVDLGSNINSGSNTGDFETGDTYLCKCG